MTAKKSRAGQVLLYYLFDVAETIDLPRDSQAWLVVRPSRRTSAPKPFTPP